MPRATTETVVEDPVPTTTSPPVYTAYPPISDPGWVEPATAAWCDQYYRPLWYDTAGRHIQAHGGQIVTTVEDGEQVHYWYGEDRSHGYVDSPGIAVYRSTDGLNWTNRGTALRAVTERNQLIADDYFTGLYGTLDQSGRPRDDLVDILNYHLNSQTTAELRAIFERPKVLYNRRTRQWVLWWHADGQIEPGGHTYARSLAAVAVSDRPTGPFRMVGAYRLYNRTDYQACIRQAVPGQSRDLTVFADEDDTAYLIYSSEENRSLYIARLDSDYTNVERTTATNPLPQVRQYSESGRYPYLFADGSPDAPVRGVDFQIIRECGVLEAPAVFRHRDRYYVLASGATGWRPNPQTYHTTTDLLGEWIRGIDPGDEHEHVASDAIPEGGDGLAAIGDVHRTTFGSQTAGVFAVAPGRYIYLGDRWRVETRDGGGSTYVWLPIVIGEDGRLELRNPAIEDPERWANGWDQSYWDGADTTP